MTATLIIPANELGVLRIYALSPTLSNLLSEAGTLEPLGHALGTFHLHDPDVQIVPLASIKDMGLPGFLQEAYDIDPDDLTLHMQILNALTGEVALIRSGAFCGQVQELPASEQAPLIASFNEPVPDWKAKPMPAQPLSRTPPRAARSRARRIGFSLFAVMMTLILLFVFWLVT